MFIIGLLTQLRGRVEAEARRRGRIVSAVLADFGTQGTARLLPIDSDAVHSFRHYMDNLKNYKDANVLVLPYTPIPEDLDEELQAAESFGGLVLRPHADSIELPKPKKRPDTPFFNAIFKFIAAQLADEIDEIAPPSEYFQHVSKENSRLLIAHGALGSCDEAPRFRWPFLMKAADAFALLLSEHGNSGGRLDAFFREQGLDHAQSGGVTATLQLRKNGECVYESTSNTHLKQGDHTSQIAATRVYYQLFSYENSVYIAILHAGPHPDRDFKRYYELSA